MTPERVMEIARECDLIAAMDAVPIPTKDILAFAARIAAEARRMALEEAACIGMPAGIRKAILALKEIEE